MPNHIKNRLTIKGADLQVNQVREYLKGKDFDDGSINYIEFNNVIERPKELDIDSGSAVMPIENQFSKNIFVKDHLDQLIEYDKSRDDSNQIETLIQGIKNYVKYGHCTWYNWSIEKWGTKWGAYSQKLIKDNVIEFETAWNAPNPIYKALAIKFPEVTFEVKYADEDTGANCGILNYSNGMETKCYLPESCTKEAYEIAFDLRPDREEDYELIDNKYQYKGEE